MFNAEGKRLLNEKHTGPVVEQLRSLTSVELVKEIKADQDKLDEILRLLRLIEAGDSTISTSKTLQNCLKLLKAYTENLDAKQAKVDSLEEGIHLMTRNLMTDVNRLVINVPVQAQHRRTLIMPHEQDSRKKRKMPGPRKPEDKKGRRLRTLKPQKVAAPKQPRKKKKQTLPRWQEQPYRAPEADFVASLPPPMAVVPVKIEQPAFDPSRLFGAPMRVPGPPRDNVKEEDRTSGSK